MRTTSRIPGSDDVAFESKTGVNVAGSFDRQLTSVSLVYVHVAQNSILCRRYVSLLRSRPGSQARAADVYVLPVHEPCHYMLCLYLRPKPTYGGLESSKYTGPLPKHNVCRDDTDGNLRC